MPVTERDFALFTPAQPAAAAPRKNQQTPRRKSAAAPAPRPRVAPVAAEPEEAMAVKKEKARAAWKKTLIAYGASAVVAVCLFGGVQTELSYLKAVSERQTLYQELDQLRQQGISRQAAIEQKYSLDIIQEYALGKLHMVPIEGGRIWYLTHPGGDTILQ
ncbi:MAG: hypothetical protein LBS96_04635 [Oscillospiraceae bacterium]|jgi:hypothetical protein|nr:hypothetical protein [Oscillospiraceae bacterium]